jgi:hypothetical protein
VNTVKILGVNITKNHRDLKTNFNGTVQKLVRIANHWGRFNLSLPGRIAIFKTFMLSQIGYLGCIITPDNEQLLSMEMVITSFVKGRLNVAKDRLYSKPEEGGLGLINVRYYISSLQVSWFKKIMNKPWDNWRRDIFNLCGGNIFIASKQMVTGKNCPILEGLFAEFENFRRIFIKQDNDLAKSDLLYNPVFKEVRDPRATVTVTESIFAHNRPPIEYNIAAKIRINDLVDVNGVKTLDAMCTDNGIPFTLTTYMRLAGPLNIIADKIVRNSRGL